jgi:6-phosphogluconolactonase
LTDWPIIRVVPSPEAVCETAAEAIIDAMAVAITARGVAHWATTGGSVAPGIYAALRQRPLRDRVDWSRVQVWWGDDRFVRLGDQLCNAGQFEVFTSGEDAVVLPPANVHIIPSTEAIQRGEGPTWAAARYEEELRADGPPPDGDGVPVLDVIVLGMGRDGHIMSVFPGSAVFDERALVAGVPPPEHIEPHVARVTMHPRLVTAARSVVLATDGPTKADALARALAGDDPRELPVRLAAGPRAIWVLDEAAAAGLR